MKLYGSLTSPFVRHCRMVAIETQAPLEFIEIDASVSAVQSPTKRMPYFEDGDIFLADSSAIIRYLRERNGEVFCKTISELDQLCLINTLLEVTTNLFFLNRDGVKIDGTAYGERHKARIDSTLAVVEQLPLAGAAPYNDVELRLAAYIGWCELREVQSFTNYPNIQAFYRGIANYPAFMQTLPPQV